MKGVFILAALAAMASARASFELMIISDAATGFHRFDAPTGTYLGSFGAGQSQSTLATWGSVATGKFYALSSSGMRSWNYSTGEYLGLVHSNTQNRYATNDANGNFVTVNGSSTATIYGLDGSTTNVFVGGSLQWIYRHDDGRYYMGDSSTGGRILRTTGTVMSGSATVVASALGATLMPGTARQAMAHIRPAFSGGENAIYTHDTTTTDALYKFDTSYGYTGGSSYGVPFLTTRNGAARAHFGIYHVGQTSLTGTTGVYYFDDGSAQRYFTTTALGNPTSMTIINAPEPGTYAAVGLGLVGLLRRRRK